MAGRRGVTASQGQSPLPLKQNTKVALVVGLANRSVALPPEPAEALAARNERRGCCEPGVKVDRAEFEPLDHDVLRSRSTTPKIPSALPHGLCAERVYARTTGSVSIAWTRAVLIQHRRTRTMRDRFG